MSDMEYNKGTLTLVSEDVEEFAGICYLDQADAPEGYDSALDWFEDCAYEADYVIIDGKVYDVTFIVKRGALDETNNLDKVSEGVYNFETYHHNGGGCWSELVEDKMKKLKEESE